MDVAGVASGDRALYQGAGQLHGKQCDVLAVRRPHATIRFDAGFAVLTLAAHLLPIPRRPPPMF